MSKDILSQMVLQVSTCQIRFVEGVAQGYSAHDISTTIRLFSNYQGPSCITISTSIC